MESNIDTLINFSYKNGKYQKLLLFFCFVTWLNSNLFNTSMSFILTRIFDSKSKQ